MGLLPARMPTDAEIVMYLGHDEVRNLERSEVLDRIEAAAASWTSCFQGTAIQVSATLGPDVEYGEEYDPSYPFRVCWTYALHCSLATTTGYTSDLSLRKRLTGALIWLGLGADSFCEWGPYCWYDCSLPHDDECGLDSYDVEYILRHEFGHMFGLDHYAWCDYGESVMYGEADLGCARHELGSVDVAYAQWMYEGIQWDEDEPDDDYSTGATYLGVLSPSQNQIQDNGNELPGLNDIDWKVFQAIDLDEEVGVLVFTLVNYEGVGDLDMVIICNHVPVAYDTTSAPGDGEFQDLPARNGVWHVAVFSNDYRQAGEYGLVVQYYRPTSSASYGKAGIPRIELVNALQEIRGWDLPEDGRLALYDIQGRLVREWQVPRGRTWAISLRGLGLASGVYWVRVLAPGMEPVGRKLILVK
jgi:hypothetical protein